MIYSLLWFYLKKPQVSLDYDVHSLLKRYCAIKGKRLGNVASKILRAFLETKHEEIESEGNMIINGEREKPKTIITILEEDQEEEEPTRLEEEPRRSLKEEPRRSPKGIEIVKKGNRYVVKKRKAK